MYQNKEICVYFILLNAESLTQRNLDTTEFICSPYSLIISSIWFGEIQLAGSLSCLKAPWV